MKKILAILTVTAILGAFFVGTIFAWGDGKTNKGWVVTGTGTCVSKHICGSTAGTQSTTLTCQAVQGADESCTTEHYVDTTYNYVDPTLSCNTGYHLQNDGNLGQRCHRDHECSFYPHGQCPVEHVSPNTTCDEGTKVWHNNEWQCKIVDVAGLTVPADTKTGSQNCTLPEPDYGSCTPAGQCPTACGQQASEIPDGKGGTMSCDATPACVRDVCGNIDGVQTSVPDGYYVEDEDVCLPKQEEPTPTPTQEPAPVVAQSSSPSQPSAPQCSDPAISQEVANPHVYRKGDQAIVKWYYEPSNQYRVAIYYGHNNVGIQYATIVENKPGEATINGLGNGDISFWLQFLNGCNSGPLSKAIVDGATKGWVLFR